MSSTSPFVFDGPLPPEQLVGREHEVAALWDRAASGRFCLLQGPRRYGKTSIIARLAAEAAATKDLVVVSADLEGVLTIDDLTRRLIAAYGALGRGPFADATRRLLATAGDALLRAAGRRVGLDLGGGVFRAVDQLPSAALEAVLAIPGTAARRTSTRVLVVLDEFQAIQDVDNGAAVLRSQIQHQREHVSYLFSGSEQGILRAIFATRAAPLYGQAERFEIGPLGDDVATDYVERLFDATGRRPGDAVAPVVTAAAGHPQRLNLLAHHLWGVVGDTAEGDDRHAAAAVDAAMRQLRPEHEAVWTVLGTSQRRLLRVLAYGEPPHGAAARRLGLGGGASTAARRHLVEQSIVFDDGTFVDPLLARWITSGQPAP